MMTNEQLTRHLAFRHRLDIERATRLQGLLSKGYTILFDLSKADDAMEFSKRLLPQPMISLKSQMDIWELTDLDSAGVYAWKCLPDCRVCTKTVQTQK